MTQNRLNESSLKKIATVKPPMQAVVNRAAEILANSDVFFVVTTVCVLLLTTLLGLVLLKLLRILITATY